MKNIKLENNVICIRVMEESDTEELIKATQDQQIWKHMTKHIKSEKDAIQYIQQALLLKDQGIEIPFVMIDQQSNKIIGSTRFLDIHLEHKCLEIGSTWLVPSYWRTPANTNCKFLLLRYCFETMGLHRVQLKTDHENFRSQKAIERIGAKKEGILRNHMIRPDGTIRHTVMYSITNEGWPKVKAHLQQLMGLRDGSGVPKIL
ncbi:GNAT family N-acetyltransferase [Bacillus sp. S/N-304-OC-R1]|uniref:GNAT family N-acetyltransferase n=1 Tax=Bacillus sp. S/N-304-OC-R1 TaxID=2758034 RepID=UPI001C8EFACB|nr:GNAT family protein [Bacillus sp. S/N-304-OC-R1]MBY0121508.1 GNAT family N-acetyltransferase [Bacillus sp. S/N-304-OC-R1]